MAGVNGHDELCLAWYPTLTNAGDCVYCLLIKRVEYRAIARDFPIDPALVNDRWTTDWDGMPE